MDQVCCLFERSSFVESYKSRRTQVFNVLPVRPDDEAAFAAHHKAEAEKRLTVERCVDGNHVRQIS